MDIKQNSKTRLIDTKWGRFDEKKRKKKKLTKTKTNKHEYLFFVLLIRVELGS
jgi:hypothetical protein